MTRRTAWGVGFLGITAVAVGAEVFAAFDGNDNTVPWTGYLTQLPWWVTIPLAVVLGVWLPTHFVMEYRAKNRDEKDKT